MREDRVIRRPQRPVLFWSLTAAIAVLAIVTVAFLVLRA